jgi:hypothetical protein
MDGVETHAPMISMNVLLTMVGVIIYATTQLVVLSADVTRDILWHQMVEHAMVRRSPLHYYERTLQSENTPQSHRLCLGI